VADLAASMLAHLVGTRTEAIDPLRRLRQRRSTLGAAEHAPKLNLRPCAACTVR
jgi:hypothetical protein